MLDFAQLATRCTAALLTTAMLISPLSAQQSQPLPQAQNAGQGLYRFRVTSDLVLVSVTARDKYGRPVRDLKQSDFTIVEDGKQQRIASFDVEDVENFAQDTGPSQAETQAAIPSGLLTSTDITKDALRDRRFIVLFFDFSAMEQDEVERAMSSAQNFISKQMSPADLVAIVSLSTALVVNQDFTNDRQQLTDVLRRLQGLDASGMEQTNMSDVQEDTGAAFSADDTEYNIFNTDLRLQAIAQVSQVLSRIDQKKAILYFSGGVQQTGTENQSQLRAAINAAVRANVSLYPVDTRGLQAFAGGGSASSASVRGNSAYTGRANQQQFDSNFQTQETLATLATDTGGRAFFDTNDFSKAYDRVQADTSTYFVLGYRSTDTRMDGRYRHITVKVNRPDLKLEYRKGYYGPRDFQHFTREDREQQLQDEIASDLPDTDVPVYLATELFRSQDDKYFVPVSLVVPGSAIPFTPATEKDKSSLDILGIVREADTKFPVGNIRDTVKIALEGTQQARRQNVQYNTGFLLAPGSYHLKFVIRENQNGSMGSFETDVTVPDLKKSSLRMSSVVIANQKSPAPKKKSPNPLVRDGLELIPNIAHVFRTDQNLYLYYEVYDPARAKVEENGKSVSGIRVLSSVQFFRGKVKAYETPVVEARQLNTPDRKAAAFQLEVPLSQLKPGWYTCQVNVIDDA
ncbi:MAG TPA: VWA domain-containing protein, partial [Terriglobales bacterium]